MQIEENRMNLKKWEKIASAEDANWQSFSSIFNEDKFTLNT